MTRPRHNEAMNLRAADAVAIAADNAASKRRRPGPQLMAGALAGPPSDRLDA